MSTLIRWAIVAAAVFAALMGAYESGHSSGDKVGYGRGHAEAVDVQARWDKDRMRTAQAALTEVARQAANTAAIEAARQEAERHAEQERAARVAAVARADGEHRRLLDAARALAAATSGRDPARPDPAAVPGSVVPPEPAELLADVLGRADDEAGELALYADALHGALGACRADYEAVRTHQ